MTGNPDEPGTPKEPRGPSGRFQKGRSGNPKGCPAGSRNLAARALDALAEGRASAILDTMVEKAQAGDVQAATLILSRVWPQRKGRATPLDMPPIKTPADLLGATSALIAAVADGTLSGEEAQSVAAVLAVHRGALETLELETRVAALEAAKARP